MNKFLSWCIFFALAVSPWTLKAQFRRLDTTIMSGTTGYRVFCSNTKNDQNQVDIRLVGFEKGARGMSIYLNGKMDHAVVDDLNNDNYPDLLIIAYSGPHFQYGTAYAFASKENQSVLFFSSKDIMLDGKLNPGYRGQDRFSMFQGTLIQKFPIFRDGDADDKPTGGKRVIQYEMVVNDAGRATFKVVRTFDEK